MRRNQRQKARSRCRARDHPTVDATDQILPPLHASRWPTASHRAGCAAGSLGAPLRRECPPPLIEICKPGMRLRLAADCRGHELLERSGRVRAAQRAALPRATPRISKQACRDAARALLPRHEATAALLPATGLRLLAPTEGVTTTALARRARANTNAGLGTVDDVRLASRQERDKAAPGASGPGRLPCSLRGASASFTQTTFVSRHEKGVRVDDARPLVGLGGSARGVGARRVTAPPSPLGYAAVATASGLPRSRCARLSLVRIRSRVAATPIKAITAPARNAA